MALYSFVFMKRFRSAADENGTEINPVSWLKRKFAKSIQDVDFSACCRAVLSNSAGLALDKVFIVNPFEQWGNQLNLAVRPFQIHAFLLQQCPNPPNQADECSHLS